MPRRRPITSVICGLYHNPGRWGIRITPLANHAKLHIPKLSDLFADSLGVTSIDVVQGGTVTLNCASAHGVPLGQQIGLTIVDAETPNPITAATVIDDGSTGNVPEVELTTQHPHDLTWHSHSDLQQWIESVKLDGFGSPLMDGTKSLKSVKDRNVFSIIPTGGVASVTIDGGETLYEKLERELVGWKRVTAATATTLTYPTPASVTRTYTVTTPVAVRNFRIFGAATEDLAFALYNRDDATPIPADKAAMFIVPIDVNTSRSKNARTDALAEINDGSDYRHVMIDGFNVLVAIPSEHSAGSVKGVDLANGDVLKAVNSTFMGLKLPQPEFYSGGSYVALLAGHAPAGVDKANYWHRYRYQALATIANQDAIAPFDWADIQDVDVVPDHLPPVGAPALHDMEIDILHHGHDEPLIGSFRVEDDGDPET